jgi:diguanylate cyclase (GGDEF)-like protein
MRKTSTFAFLCMLLTIVLIGYNLQLQKKLVFKENETAMAGVLGSVEADIKRAVFGLDQVFHGLHNYLETCSRSDLQNRQEIRRILDELVAHNNYLVGINIVDPNGDVIHGNGDIVRPNLQQRNFFAVHAAGMTEGLYISPPQPSLIFDDQWTTGISKAIRQTDGSLDLVLLGIIDLKYFFQSYGEFITEPGFTLTILSPQGLVYSRIPDHSSTVGRQYPEFAGDGDLSARTLQSGMAYLMNSDGSSEAVIFKQLRELPLVIRVARSETAMLAPWRETGRILTLLGVVICLTLLYFAVFAHNAEKKQQATMERLRIQSTIDELTRLYNRRHFLDEAHLETKKARRSNLPLSLIMVDLDHFKEINDQFGHHTGDMVLRECADLLKKSCRETDLVGRFGGEEFVLLLPATDQDGALSIADKIRRIIANHQFDHQHRGLHITASLGVTQIHRGEDNLDKALKRADIFLYEAKNAGRNAIRPTPERRDAC